MTPSAGTYFAAVTPFSRVPLGLAGCGSDTALIRPDGAVGGSSFAGCTPGDDSIVGVGFFTGAYTLHVSVEGAGAPAAVPEPGTLALLGLGAGILAAHRRARG